MALTYLGPTEIEIEPGKSTTAIDIGAGYDSISDELNLWLGASPRPHITEPVNAFTSILFDMESGEAIGVRVENFTAFAIYQHPDLIPLAKYLGIALREHGDVALFSHRLSLETSEISDSLREAATYVIKYIVQATGGFEPGLASIEVQDTPGE